MEWNSKKKIFHYQGTYEVNTCKKTNSSKHLNTDSEKELKGPRVKARYLVILLIFLGEVIYFYHQVTISVNIVAMVNNSAIAQEEGISVTPSCPVDITYLKNSSSEKAVQVEGEFLWSPEEQGYILGSGWLCILSVPVFSRLAEMYGGKRVLFWCLFLMSTFTFLSPFAAQWNVYALILIQSLRGMAQGGIVPTESILVANWSTKQERGISYTLVLTGCAIGAIFGSYLSGLLCEMTALGGWKTSFFVSGGIGFSVSALIWFFLHDNPRVHPTISVAELHYIISNQETVLTEKRPKTPWKRLFTSVPVYALGYAYFGQMWTISHFNSMNPTFLKTILNYSVEKSGLFAALPTALLLLESQVSGFLFKFLNSRKLIGIDKSRKFCTSISCLGYSCCILGICFAECNRPIIITLSMLAYGFTGFANAGCWIVCNDMSPTFSASINAIAFTMGNLSYFVLPFTVGQFTNNLQTLEQWHKVFYICIAVVLSSGIVFAIFGSAEIQPWNYVTDDKQSDSSLKMKSGCQSGIKISDDCKKDKAKF